jgi:phosphatidate phosphatase APP1
VGDSGEKDPEIYGQVAREFPRQVRGIFIRDVTDENRASERYKRAFREVPEPAWVVFQSSSELLSFNPVVTDSE